MEAVLDAITARLDAKFKSGTIPKDSDEFEDWVIEELITELAALGLPTLDDRVDQQFPDLTMGSMGLEVKYVSESLWSGVANSISETHRIAGLKKIYLIFGRGGKVKSRAKNPPAPIRGVKWGKYEEVVYHARTSHRLRFEIDMEGRVDRPSLFSRWGVEYEDFAQLPYSEKMGYMQAYARSRQQEDNALDFWWLPPTPKPYVDLESHEQDEALALACLMCPQIVTGSDQARKDVAVCMQLLKGVLAHEMAAVIPGDPVVELERISNVVVSEADKAIFDVFQVYWGIRPDRPQRIYEWVKRLDAAHIGASLPGPLPSTRLFGGRYVGQP